VHTRAGTSSVAAGGILFCATALMLVFRQKYPGWWFDWNVALTAFGIWVMAYLALADFWHASRMRSGRPVDRRLTAD
jgi:hypothetical protein